MVMAPRKHHHLPLPLNIGYQARSYTLVFAIFPKYYFFFNFELSFSPDLQTKTGSPRAPSPAVLTFNSSISW
jgi:hypothetical protein